MKRPAFFITYAVRNILKLLLVLMMVFAIYFFIRGHNEPGGGFIAGVVLSIGTSFVFIVKGNAYIELLRIQPLKYAAVGVLISVSIGLVPWLVGDAFLTQYMTYLTVPFLGKLHVGTPLIFDFGILLCVWGVITEMVIGISKEVISFTRDEN